MTTKELQQVINEVNENVKELNLLLEYFVINSKFHDGAYEHIHCLLWNKEKELKRIDAAFAELKAGDK